MKVKPYAVDSGWAWLVLFADFIAFCILGGLGYSTGIYYVEILRRFGKSHSETAWVISLHNTFFHLGSVVSSRFVEQFGHRSGMFMGATLLTLGALGSSFASSFYQILIMYGIIVGIGWNFILVSLVLVLNQYFDHYHSLALSFVLSGNGVGLFFISILMEYFVDEYGWQISFLVYACLTLQFFVAGSFFYDNKTGSKSIIKEVGNSPRIISSNRNVQGKQSTQNCLSVSENMDCLEVQEDEPISPIQEQDDAIQQVKKQSLLRDVKLWLLCAATFMLYLSNITYFIIFKDFLIESELVSASTIGLSLIGVGDFIGRLLLGGLVSMKCMNATVLHTVSILTTAIVLLLHVFVQERVLLLTLATLFGVTYGAQMAALALVSLHVFGKQLMPRAYGLMTTTVGISCFVGPPIVGAIIDLSNSYRVCFTCLSGNCFLAVLFMMSIHYTRYRSNN